MFLDLGIAGGPILLGLAAQASGIPFAFGVAAAGGAGRLRVDSGAEPHDSARGEIAVDLLDGGGALADGRGDALYRTVPYVASGEYTGNAGLLREWWSVQ